MRSLALRALPALACATVLALSACGSGGGSSSAGSNGGTATSHGGTASPKVTAKGGGDFCKSLANSLNESKSLATSAINGQPSNLKALIDKARQEAGSIVAAAPDAIKDDVKTLVNASTSYYDALAAANYDFRKVDATKLQSLTSSNVQQASQRVEAYIQSHCGISVGATP